MIYYAIQYNTSLTIAQNPAGEYQGAVSVRFPDLGTTYLKVLRVDSGRCVTAAGSVRCDLYVDVNYFNNVPRIVPVANVDSISPGDAILNGFYLSVDAYKVFQVEGLPLVHGQPLYFNPMFYGFPPGVEVPILQCMITIGVDNAAIAPGEILSPEKVYLKNEKDRAIVNVYNWMETIPL